MAQINSTQKAKLTLRAQDFALTTDVTNDYYLTVKLQKSLSVDDIANEVAALSTRQEDPEEVARTVRRSMQVMAWFLSAGYSLNTPLGYFRPTVKGVLLEDELVGSPDRSKLSLGVTYTMGEAMQQAFDDAELDVEILKAAQGPQLYAVVSAQDAGKATRDGSSPILAGETCLIKGKNIKVGGTGDTIGVTLRRQDGSSNETIFLPVSKLYPNTKTQVGFIMPTSAPTGSVWSVTLCTQLSTSTKLLKEPRTVTMADYFVVGETAAQPDSGSGSSSGGNDGDIEGI